MLPLDLAANPVPDLPALNAVQAVLLSGPVLAGFGPQVRNGGRIRLHPAPGQGVRLAHSAALLLDGRADLVLSGNDFVDVERYASGWRQVGGSVSPAVAAAGNLTYQSVLGRNGAHNCPWQTSNAGLASATPLAGGVLRAAPFLFTRRVRLTAMALWLQGGGQSQGGNQAGTRARFGIYAADPATLLPAALQVQSMPIVQSATNVAWAVSGLDLVLDAGVYHFAVANDAAANRAQVFRGLAAAGHRLLLGMDGPAGQPVSRLEAPFTLGAAGLPARFPDGPARLSGPYVPELFTVLTTPV